MSNVHIWKIALPIADPPPFKRRFDALAQLVTGYSLTGNDFASNSIAYPDLSSLGIELDGEAKRRFSIFHLNDT